MLKPYGKNCLLIGIGKAQHLMLDLGRKLAVEQVIGEAGEIAAVVVEPVRISRSSALQAPSAPDRTAKPRILPWYRP